MTFQSVTTVTLSGPRRVTIWRAEESPTKKGYDTGSLKGSVVVNSTLLPHEMAKELIKIPRVIRVEISTSNEDGIIITNES